MAFSLDSEVKTEMSESEMHELITSAFPPPKPPKKSQTSVSSTEPESNEVQKYTPEKFQSLLNKFEQPTSPVMVSKYDKGARKVDSYKCSDSSCWTIRLL